MNNGSASGIGARPRAYVIMMMLLLCVATFCEGYDFFIISLVIDILPGEFGVEMNYIIKIVLTFINVGAILGFFVIRLGDRFGRKPILLISLCGFTTFSVITAMSPNVWAFMAAQFIAKMFLVSQFGTAIVMTIEECPAKSRATCVALLQVAGGLGGAFAMIISKNVLPAWGWRGMYWVGGAPLILAPALALLIKETAHFSGLKAAGAAAPPSLWHIWKTPSRKYVPAVGAIWFLGYLAYAGVIYFWVAFAKTERGWTVDQVGPAMAVAAVVGMTGYIVSGVMMDKIGRKLTGVLFFVAGSASLVWAFNSTGSMMLPSVVVSMFFIFAILPITSTFNAELFPTELRSNAAAWCNSLMGRPAQVAAPFIVGSITGIAGSLGNAVSFLAIGPLIAALMIAFMLPETKGVDLDKLL